VLHVALVALTVILWGSQDSGIKRAFDDERNAGWVGRVGMPSKNLDSQDQACSSKQGFRVYLRVVLDPRLVTWSLESI